MLAGNVILSLGMSVVDIVAWQAGCSCCVIAASSACLVAVGMPCLDGNSNVRQYVFV